MFRRIALPILRGTVLGSMLGMLARRRGDPGVLCLLLDREADFERRRRHSASGAIEGVAGPESANNAAAQTSFIPMLTLGIPATPVMALMIGAMIVQGITPGPTVMLQKPELFWGLIASMWIGNAMLLVLNLPLIGLWVKLLSIPYQYLFPAIIGFCCIGILSISNNPFDVYTIDRLRAWSAIC